MFQGIKLIVRQLELNDQEHDVESQLICSTTFSKQYGLQCKHLLRDYLLEDRRLLPTDYDRHWFIEQNKQLIDEENRRRGERDPWVRPSRNRNSNEAFATIWPSSSVEAVQKTNTRRDLSHDKNGNLSRLQYQAVKRRKTKAQKELEKKERQELDLKVLKAKQARMEEAINNMSEILRTSQESTQQ